MILCRLTQQNQAADELMAVQPSAPLPAIQVCGPVQQ